MIFVATLSQIFHQTGHLFYYSSFTFRAACGCFRMRVYKDLVSGILLHPVLSAFVLGDEMFTDSHVPKLIDGAIYEIDAKFITVSNALDGRLLGANPSAEDGEEKVDDGSERVIDLVHASRLVETNFEKKSFTSYLKDYLKKVKEAVAAKDPSRVPDFEKAVQGYMLKVLKNFSDYQFFIGESMDPNGCVALMNYREDGVTPYFVILKDGLVEEKYVSPNYELITTILQ
ncbi:uncharacterized protein DEA37_0011317 [Paragonimus westermani]|uniref:Translationally-controlled tumor protein homolog n=1 Tax=Paragonimus westermani TaxID=34504 RepID=A0A5J4ND36_9TREM|nr:uncharacterized protein DEA37_0011317 [Paragonimus westermani]